MSNQFEPTWDSLSKYKCPEWFRDAKFGIWAHWGPQCEPGQGDWYARSMYIEGHPMYQYHCEHYGHPSEFGFKDIDNAWKAQNWDPGYLLSRFRSAGAKYLVAMASHHDNFDLFDSTHQEWNSVKIGPKRDIIGEWASAAASEALRFGVSVHSSHAWSWFEVAQGADKTGPYAGVPYDGKLTKADGKGKWWEGLDPQHLYRQDHEPSEGFQDLKFLWDQKKWAWGNGVSIPSAEYIQNFGDRTFELVDKYHPDLVCFDDTIMPLHPLSDIGLRITAHVYNQSIERAGKLDAVVNTKCLETDQQKQSVVWDIERGGSSSLLELPWQTETCIGQWHYDADVFTGHAYNTPEYVVRTLIDIVSKNGNLLLSIPIKGDGTIDSDEEAFLTEIGEWMALNGEAIYGTRPWHIYGEGPLADAEKSKEQGIGFDEGEAKTYSSNDIRFTTKDRTLFAFLLKWPEGNTVTIKSLGKNSGFDAQQISLLSLVGHAGQLVWMQEDHGLTVDLPANPPGKHAWAIKIERTGV